MNKDQLQGILQCKNFGIKKTKDILEPGFMFTTVGKGLYECKSMSGNTYLCDIENKTCTCKSWYYSKEPKICKHLKKLGVKDNERKRTTKRD